jgi:site-specific recombinase XerC
LVEEGEITESPMARMRPPRKDEKEVPIIPQDHLARLFEACSGKTFLDRRDAAILRILLNSGPRLGELAGIKLEDVDLSHREIAIMGKGRRARSLPLGPKAHKALVRYLRERARHKHADLPYLWIGRYGRLGDQGVVRMIRRRAAQAGLPFIHPHQFRHTFAHEWLSAGGNEHDLARLAGWSSLQMVGRYAASAAVERAKEAHARFSPGEDI